MSNIGRVFGCLRYICLILDKKNMLKPVWAGLDEFWHVVASDTEVNIADLFQFCLY